ncbi:hypothetical protein BCR42DRAFT_397840 [Absidia repens]|uniref:Uncharacterized protein n=1 Tax=Absidia repens TaxID=90262 RepID=A0A1X2HZP5_9FUNG|nr:hypothetical protein BCR42DRAFT_397840 [Absidia repens]
MIGYMFLSGRRRRVGRRHFLQKQDGYGRLDIQHSTVQCPNKENAHFLRYRLEVTRTVKMKSDIAPTSTPHAIAYHKASVEVGAISLFIFTVLVTSKRYLKKCAFSLLGHCTLYILGYLTITVSFGIKLYLHVKV